MLEELENQGQMLMGVVVLHSAFQKRLPNSSSRVYTYPCSISFFAVVQYMQAKTLTEVETVMSYNCAK